MTYPAGHELCNAFVGGEPERFRRLLHGQVRVGELVAARDAATGDACTVRCEVARPAAEIL